MRHKIAGKKLGRSKDARIALRRTLVNQLFEHERIQTTRTKAEAIRGQAERLITLAKRDEGRLHARRLVLRDIRDTGVVKKLFDTLGARFASRPGGYTRILRLGPRKGDGAEMAIVELLGSEYQPKKKEEKAAKGEKADKDKPEEKKAEAKGEKKPAARQKGQPRNKKKQPEAKPAE